MLSNSDCIQRWNDGVEAGGQDQIPQMGDTESPKQGSKRFNCQVRGNNLPTWLYNLLFIYAMTTIDRHTSLI